MFSTNPIIPIAFTFALREAKVFINPVTVPAPAISYFISSMNLAGFNEIPPVSKQTPFPTNPNGFEFFFVPFHFIIAT